MNIFALMPLLPIIGKHSDLIHSLTGLAPDAEGLFSELVAVINKHQITIKEITRLTPEIQQLVNESMAVIRAAQQ